MIQKTRVLAPGYGKEGLSSEFSPALQPPNPQPRKETEARRSSPAWYSLWWRGYAHTEVRVGPAAALVCRGALGKGRYKTTGGKSKTTCRDPKERHPEGTGEKTKRLVISHRISGWVCQIGFPETVGSM